jgi:hypothetical protein
VSKSFGTLGKGATGASTGMSALVGAAGAAVGVLAAVGVATLKAYEFISPIEQRFNKLSKTIQRFAKISGDSLADATVEVASFSETFGESEEEIFVSRCDRRSCKFFGNVWRVRRRNCQGC